MPIIKPIRGKKPQFGKGCFLAENCVVIGDVILGEDCSVWFNSVIRGDVNSIRIGNKVNIQDGAIIHCTYRKASTIIGDRVSIGHNALVHGCTLHDNVLIGMGAIVMDHAVVESNCIVAAGAVVLENSHLESGCIYAGVPARKVKHLSESQLKELIERTADNYVLYSNWYE